MEEKYFSYQYTLNSGETCPDLWCWSYFHSSLPHLGKLLLGPICWRAASSGWEVSGSGAYQGRKFMGVWTAHTKSVSFSSVPEKWLDTWGNIQGRWSFSVKSSQVHCRPQRLTGQWHCRYYFCTWTSSICAEYGVFFKHCRLLPQAVVVGMCLLQDNC